MATKKDLIPSILNKVRTTYQNSINDNQGWFRQGKFTTEPLQSFATKMTDDNGFYRGDKDVGIKFTPFKAIGDFNPTGNMSLKQAFNKLPEQAKQDWGQAGLVRNNPLLQKFAPKTIEPLATAVELGPAAYMNQWAKTATTFSRDTTPVQKGWDILGAYGSLNPAYATKNLAAGPLGVAFNTVSNKINNLRNGDEPDVPLMTNWKQGWQQGQEFQFHANPINQATGHLVDQIAKFVPSLQKFTNAAIASNSINPGDSFKQAFGKWMLNSGKKLLKAATLETAVETPIWATMTKTEQETYLQAVEREALQNLVMNTGMSALGSLVDARSLAPIVKNSIDTAFENYWKNQSNPQSVAKQAGYIDFMGNVVDGTDRTNRFNNLVDTYYSTKSTPQQKIESLAEIKRLATDVFGNKKIKSLSIGLNEDPENLIMALSDVLNKDIPNNTGYQEPFTLRNLLANKELQRGGMDLTDKTKGFPQTPDQPIKTGGDELSPALKAKMEYNKWLEDDLSKQTPTTRIKTGNENIGEISSPTSKTLPIQKTKTTNIGTLEDGLRLEKQAWGLTPKNKLDRLLKAEDIYKKIGDEQRVQELQPVLDRLRQDLGISPLSPESVSKPQNDTSFFGKPISENELQIKSDIQKASQTNFKFSEGNKVEVDGKPYIISSSYVQDGESRYLVYPPGKKNVAAQKIWIHESDITSPKTNIIKPTVSNVYTKENVKQLLDANPENNQLNNLYYGLRNFDGDVSNILTPQEKNLINKFSNLSPESKGIKPALIDKKIDLAFRPKKIDLELEPTKQTLPWEEPEYVAKNGGLKTKDSPVLKTGTLKQELNQLQTKAPLKSQPIISPELKADIQKGSLSKKVNLIDWFRTPDRVLTKIGLGDEAKQIRTSYNKYLDDLPVEISKVTKWYDQVKGSPDASKRLFQYLDGQDVQLNKTELKVAGEMKSYLKGWADKLDLPEDKRVSNYITHIFEKDFIKKEFDEDLAKIIADRVPGSVYDPFTQERLGKTGYVEDVFRALDAYVKRGVRKFNMDPALESLSKSSDKLPLESWKYVKSFADRVNLRPTQIDTYIDDLVKQSPVGYKLGQRPVTATTKKLRQAVYRGTLGLNVGSALRNLTQGVNTYAKLGEKYTAIGYMRNLKEMASGGEELKLSGVLRDDLIQDRQLSAVKGVMQKLDAGLFSFFNLAEKINRGSAYFGAKAKYLNEGLNEKAAIEKAVELVRKTQFTFGSVDTPVAMQSDIAKTLGQFQSFNLKQAEFLGEMIGGKDIAGMLRWVAGNALLMFTVGNLIGIDLQDIIPFGGVFTGETKLGVTPPIQAATDLYKAGINAPDKYGNVSEDGVFKRLGGAITKNAPAFIPAGIQLKKTFQGINAVNQEGSYSKTGRLQYPIEKKPENYLRAGLFGKSNLPVAREYFNNDGSVLGEKQTEFYKQSTDKQGVYKSFMSKRQEEKALDEAKKQLETSGGVQQIGGKILYQSDTGDIKTLDLGKVSRLPEQTAYQRALKQKEAYKIVDDVLDNLEGDQQIEALQALGITSADATYYNTARQENYLKTIYVEEEIRNMIGQGQTKDQILNTLASMRRAVNEKILLADGVINDLVDKNIISYQDGKALKNIDKDLKPKKLKAKKPKKISVSRPKASAIKEGYTPIKYSTSKSKTKAQLPKYVKPNFTTSFKLL